MARTRQLHRRKNNGNIKTHQSQKATNNLEKYKNKELCRLIIKLNVKLSVCIISKFCNRVYGVRDGATTIQSRGGPGAVRFFEAEFPNCLYQRVLLAFISHVLKPFCTVSKVS